MESANLHDHQQQQQLVESSPLVNPSFYEVGTTRAPSSTPYPILNNNGTNFNPNIINGAAINSRDPYCLINASNSMIQDLGFGSFTSLSSLSAHDLQLSRIKEELPSSSSSNHSSYPKFTELLNSSPSSSSSIDLDSHLLFHPSSNSSSYIKNEQRDQLLKTFASGCQINGLQPPPAAAGGGGLFYSTPTSRRSFSQIYPTINISNLNDQLVPASNSEVSSSSLVMNLEALDLFNSARFSGTTNIISHSSQDHRVGLSKSGLDYNMRQQLSHRPSNSPTNVSPFNNGVPEVKRSSSFLETKAVPQSTPKKSRLDSRSSCPPFKVRKEKLGDRIAALQQLVAPFGKTDTASVLMEAIGYIKFLQNQVETLSVPYMKSSRNKARKMQGGSGEDGESTRDLRSRGLCLVPLTCLSYVTDGGGGAGVWPPGP